VQDLPPPQPDREVFEFDDRYGTHGVTVVPPRFPVPGPRGPGSPSSSRPG
jgi:hypothetical protein